MCWPFTDKNIMSAVLINVGANHSCGSCILSHVVTGHGVVRYASRNAVSSCYSEQQHAKDRLSSLKKMFANLIYFDTRRASFHNGIRPGSTSTQISKQLWLRLTEQRGFAVKGEAKP